MTGADYSYKERLLVAPNTNSFWRVRMESTLQDSYHSDGSKLTPFPQYAHDLLQRHNATSIHLQVGTSATHSYFDGLDNPAGPSGVLVHASLRGGDLKDFEALLRDLVGRRILLAPFFSFDIRRLHRHLIELDAHEGDEGTRQFEIVLPTEGAALSSEGMKAFQTTFSPCRDESGIASWNDPQTMSELFVNRESAERHSMWIQLESMGTNSTRITKGLQFYPRIHKHDQISLADFFPASQRHRKCPFADETTLDVILNPKTPSLVRLEQEPSNQYIMENPSGGSQQVQVIHMDPAKQWKQPLLTLQDATTIEGRNNPLASIHQTIQRPRGVAYTGRFVTQLTLSPPDNKCPLTAQIQWFVPPIVQPTWQSFQVSLNDLAEQTEQSLDWRQDLNGSIISTDKHIRFVIPQFHATSPSVLTIQWDYRPAFLSFEHFPGDANRGVEVPPAVVQLQGSCVPPEARLYSSSLLILPPVPDMSMPFNVLSMTCSLYAFIIGSLLNLLIRKSSERVRRTYDPSIAEKEKANSKIAKVKAKLKALIGGKFKGKKGNDSEGGEAKGNNKAEDKVEEPYSDKLATKEKTS